MPRFFVDKNAVLENNNVKMISITGEDAHHISRSLRMAVGEKIEVVDNKKTVYLCSLVQFGEKEVLAEVIDECQAESEPKYEILLFQALPKSDKMETIIQKSTECGACEIIPFRSERCVVKLDSKDAERKRERWQKIAEGGAKQCGRGIIPTVHTAMDFVPAIEKAMESSLVLFCNEREDVSTLKTALEEAKIDGKISIIIGSEGGFSEKEAEYIIQKGAKSVSLGKRILRCETAPTFVLSCIAYHTEM
ncbi:MAG: 16S rRNA (uracil(1498)-N(3))-methyltransferase [Clostridia bacterium]|nr:16S rRNA (uracil(1498)-N(3))-methyltransferase [Clostridia bacterium]